MGVRPLHAALRRPRGSVHGGVHPAGGPGRGHQPHPAGRPRHRRDLPPPVGAGGRGGHASTTSRAGGSTSASAPPGTPTSTGGWASTSRRPGAGGAAGGGDPGGQAPVDRGRRPTSTAATTGCGAATTTPGRCSSPTRRSGWGPRRAAHAAHRRPPGRRVARLRVARGPGPQVGHRPPGGGGGGPRPGRDRPLDRPVAVGAVGRGPPAGRRPGRHRLLPPHRQLAGRGLAPHRGVRQPGDARPCPDRARSGRRPSSAPAASVSSPDHSLSSLSHFSLRASTAPSTGRRRRPTRRGRGGRRAGRWCRRPPPGGGAGTSTRSRIPRRSSVMVDSSR